MSSRVAMSSTVRRGRSIATPVAAVLMAAVALAGCSSDGSEGGDAPRRTTTTEADGAEATSTTEAAEDTTSTAPPATPTTAAPTTAAGGGGSSAFRGTVDGQDGVEVTFTRGATALTDVRAEGLELTCQPLAGGDPETTTVDVAMAEVPLGATDLVEHTESGATYEPTISGSFTDAGSFAGSLYLSGQADGFACGGEFTFIATPG